MRRKRKGIQQGAYEDPLKDYSPPQFEDDLEQALCDTELATVDMKPFDAISPKTKVIDAMKNMAELGIACLMVARDDGKIVGVFTERDVLEKVAEDFEQVKNLPVRVVMTPNPICAYEMDLPAKALNLMATGGFRHIPILDADDHIVGILGPRRVTRFLQTYFTN